MAVATKKKAKVISRGRLPTDKARKVLETEKKARGEKAKKIFTEAEKKITRLGYELSFSLTLVDSGAIIPRLQILPTKEGKQ